MVDNKAFWPWLIICTCNYNKKVYLCSFSSNRTDVIMGNPLSIYNIDFAILCETKQRKYSKVLLRLCLNTRVLYYPSQGCYTIRWMLTNWLIPGPSHCKYWESPPISSFLYFTIWNETHPCVHLCLDFMSFSCFYFQFFPGLCTLSPARSYLWIPEENPDT